MPAHPILLSILYKYTMEEPSQPTSVAPATLHTKARSLQAILDQLGPITSVSYTPFQPEEPKQEARALLPPLFPKKARLIDYFTLFFIHDLF